MDTDIHTIKIVLSANLYHIAQKFDGNNFDEWSTHKTLISKT